MYSESSISTLIESLGFGEPTDELSAINIDEVHLTGTLNRTFAGFHKLITLENIYATSEIIDMESIEFNAYLSRLKNDSARSSLIKVLNKNKLYQNSFDYSDTIITNIQLISEVYGYQLAYDTIQQMMVTKRQNIEKRNAKLSFSALKMELEGVVNDNGNIISKGLERLLIEAIDDVQSVLFDESLTVSDANAW